MTQVVDLQLTKEVEQRLAEEGKLTVHKLLQKEPSAWPGRWSIRSDMQSFQWKPGWAEAEGDHPLLQETPKHWWLRTTTYIRLPRDTENIGQGALHAYLFLGCEPTYGMVPMLGFEEDFIAAGFLPNPWVGGFLPQSLERHEQYRADRLRRIHLTFRRLYLPQATYDQIGKMEATT